MTIADCFRPVYSFWAMFDTLKIRDIAPLMYGVEPRVLSDFTVRDPEYPKLSRGISPDFSDFERMVIAGIAAGTLRACGTTEVGISNNTDVVIATLIPWLRTKNFLELADGLSSISVPPMGRGELVKKIELFQRHERNWRGMESDFQHAKKNGLRDMAWSGEHGYWYEDAALAWAKSNSRLTIALGEKAVTTPSPFHP